MSAGPSTATGGAAARAAALSGVPAEGDAASTQYLTFMLGGETFAIGILAIKEIIEYRGVTAVPMMPACVRGVINLRGAVVPVVDLQARFGKEPSVIGRRSCIVIVELGEGKDRHVVGVIVDAVNAVLDIEHTDIEPPPSFGARIRADFIEGMGKVRERFVILVRVDRALSIDELSGIAERSAPAPALTH